VGQNGSLETEMVSKVANLQEQQKTTPAEKNVKRV
jgi:hypothetical protein